MHFEGPDAVLECGRAILIGNHLHHRQALGGQMGDEAMFFGHHRGAAHAVVVALDEEPSVWALHERGRGKRPRAVPQQPAVALQLHEMLLQPRDLAGADRRPVGWDLVVVETLDVVGRSGHGQASAGTPWYSADVVALCDVMSTSFPLPILRRTPPHEPTRCLLPDIAAIRVFPCLP